MTRKTIELNDALYDYILSVTDREGAVLRDLREETASLPQAQMQIAPDQGQFMALLVKMLGARRVLEIGTFTGYSALAMALALPEDGSILCCDISEEWTAIARRYWVRAGVEKKIELRLGAALDTLHKLTQAPEGYAFDFAFIDADKENYDAYFEYCLGLMRPGGVIAVDNVLWNGSVIDPQKNDVDTCAIREFNDKRSEDSRVDISLVPIGDGLTLLRKR